MRDIVYFAEGAIRVVAVGGAFFSGHAKTSEEVLEVENYLLLPVFGWVLADAIVCLSNSRHRALHDMIAGTVVVRSDEPPETTGRVEPPGPEVYRELNDR